LYKKKKENIAPEDVNTISVGVEQSFLKHIYKYSLVIIENKIFNFINFLENKVISCMVKATDTIV
jgi:hypothetical protein